MRCADWINFRLFFFCCECIFNTSCSYKNIDSLLESCIDKNELLEAVLTVLGQNGSGQNGTDKMVADKMVRTKWYGQNDIQTKWYWTNCMGKMVGLRKNGMNKILRIVINQSSSHLQYDFFINPAFTLTPSAFLFIYL